MRRLLNLVVAVMVAGLLLGCNEENSSIDTIQAEQTEAALSEAQRQIGMPGIVNYQQRKLMKQIYELADRTDLITYTYIKADMTGKLIFLGKSIGFGVPFSAQFTNPMRLTKHFQNYGRYILPQADPNGLFMPTSSSATWVMLIHPKTGEPTPQYIEPEIMVFTFPIHELQPELMAK